MWAIMGVIRNEHGVYIVRKKVPEKLQAAVARVTGSSKTRQAWLQRSLRTKDLREANIRAKPVLIEFDHILSKAEALVDTRPLRTTLDDREINRLATYHYAALLAEDDELRREGSGSQELYASVASQLAEAGLSHTRGFEPEPKRAFGLTEREAIKQDQTISIILPAAELALARGDVSFVTEEVDELLDLFRINLDRSSAAYRKLGLRVLREHVRGLRAIGDRNRGEPVETPDVPEPAATERPDGENLRAAYEGWKKAKQRAPSTLWEFDHALQRFIEMHGDLPITKVTRRHVREFREALQMVPVRRSGKLRKATLPVLAEWGRNHPGAPKIAPGTVNKLLGACQTITIWARENGIIPDDIPWSDPFADMRLETEEPSREPWEVDELRVLFASPVFTRGHRPKGGRGEAAFWLPLLALFTGARLGELAPLTAADVRFDEQTGVTAISIAEDASRGRRLKTKSSRRVIPVHPELERIGLGKYVERRRALDGEAAALFPLLTPGPRGGYGEAWAKWFGRYKRSLGITNPDHVYHSLRHGFKDALRAAAVSEDVNDALTGHSGGGVGRSYGRKELSQRFGLHRLAEAVAKVAYPGLDLSHLHTP